MKTNKEGLLYYEEDRIKVFERNFPHFSNILKGLAKNNPEYLQLANNLRAELIHSIECEYVGYDDPYKNRGDLNPWEFEKKIELLGYLLSKIKQKVNNEEIFNNFQKSIHLEMDEDDRSLFYIYYDSEIKDGHCHYIIRTNEQNNKYIPYIEKSYENPMDGKGLTKLNKDNGFMAIVRQISKQRLN